MADFVQKTHFDRPTFHDAAASRSFYLGQIRVQVPGTAVANLLVDLDVECLTRELAVLAWARLDGMQIWGRMLVVERLRNKRGALQPSHDELQAARQPLPASFSIDQSPNDPTGGTPEAFSNADNTSPPAQTAKDIYEDPYFLETSRTTWKAGADTRRFRSHHGGKPSTLPKSRR
ncbi:hypothetical protein INS49_014256 [Diaporthe citri]|uniref:uncharacterized protein n=1 Tax=Diaporthe citri TaxID=83186 RepID=UPI001C7F7CC5|nr:uncharacterized protein INS49_014256 [Diaporthe citri]KAG6358372.1 hypothetical protein INS49_014256 [Diaporthe citri]